MVFDFTVFVFLITFTTFDTLPQGLTDVSSQGLTDVLPQGLTIVSPIHIVSCSPLFSKSTIFASIVGSTVVDLLDFLANRDLLGFFGFLDVLVDDLVDILVSSLISTFLIFAA